METIEQQILEIIKAESQDPNYQSIDYKGNLLFKGYSGSEKTWENIQKIGIDFKDKSVGDLGSYNGYFSFKIEESGAKSVVGYDNNLVALNISSKISKLRDSKCIFLANNLGKDDVCNLDNFDIIIALNMLHHVCFQHGMDGLIVVLDKIFQSCKELLVEINSDQYELLKKYAESYEFVEQNKLESHRMGNDFNKRLLIYYKVKK